MVSVFLREQQRYTQKNIVNAFQCSEEETIRILKRLKEYGVLKLVKFTDKQKDLTVLLDEDIELTDVEVDDNEYLYVFTFVGVIIIGGRVLNCYPKYLFEKDGIKDELKLVLKVLEKYNSKEQIIRMYNGANGNSGFNMLAIMLYLLQDYYEYGAYINTQDIIETNGSGYILWDKTINETFALISDNRPYYPELLTKKRINDDFDYFKRLHECILTKCSEELNDAGLLELFDIIGVDISDEEIDDFGEQEYILEQIQKELNIQFNTRKQLLLKTLYAYIAHNSHLDEINGFSLFGTNSFNLVWENVCAEVMGNQLKNPLGTLKLPTELSSNYNKKDLLISLIEKPLWYGNKSNDDSFCKVAADTLIPDFVSIINNKGEYQFLIFDAKYYNIQLEEDRPLKGQPGIESITKQYLYQLAYQKFIKEHNISKIINCFLIPTQGEKIINKGYVKMEMLHALNLENIQLRLLPTKTMYSLYIQNKKMDLHMLNL